jgi:putative transposase
MALSKSALSDLLDALRAGGDLDVIREGLALVLQALIETEAAQQIGADRYERSTSRTTHRNGTRARLLSTKAGDVELRIPKLREGSFFPALLEPRRRIDRALLAVVMEAYVHGTSTRKVDDLVKALGVDAGISKSEVSRICAELDGEVASFRSRSLAHTSFPYLFVDATYLKARVDGRVVSRAVVIATGVTADGGREVLGLDVGDSEDGAFWTAFLRSLKARGLAGVQLVVSDAHTGSRPLSARSWPAPAGSVAGSTSSATCSRGCHEDQPRWSPRPSARSSPSPPVPRSSTSSTRSRPCSHPSSRPWRRCWPTPART